MYLLLALLTLFCLFLGISLARLCMDIRALCGQLEEIDRGSHIELTTATRWKSVLALCRNLNRILSARDQEQIRYARAEKQLKQNVTNLAHDIRTPLTGASGYLQMARECEDSEKRDRYLVTASRRLEELEDMLEKMFLYTKLTNREFSFPPENMKKIPALPLLDDCLLSFYTKFQERGICPDISFQSESFRVLADEDALRRIFLNLLQNVLIHGKEHSTLRIIQHTTNPSSSDHIPSQDGTPQSTPWAGCLTFENPVPQGAKLHPELLFDLFYKGDTARRKGSSGLGLFIVKELMKRMGGDATADYDGETLRISLHFREQ